MKPGASGSSNNCTWATTVLGAALAAGAGLAGLVEQALRRDPAARLNVQLPDEKSRRVGQSIAAASLPALKG